MFFKCVKHHCKQGICRNTGISYMNINRSEDLKIYPYILLHKICIGVGNSKITQFQIKIAKNFRALILCILSK
jgi:hypothetical protein